MAYNDFIASQNEASQAMSYNDYSSRVEKENQEIVEDSKEEITQAEADAINRKKSNLNIIGYVFTILLTVACLVIAIILLVMSFDSKNSITHASNNVEKLVKKVVKK